MSTLRPFWALALAGAVSILPHICLAQAGPYSSPQANSNPGAIDPGIGGFITSGGVQTGTASGNVVNPIFNSWASSVINYAPSPGVSPQFQTPLDALGPVGPSTTTVSLGEITNPVSTSIPGSITLGFSSGISNGVGADFAVFENGFVSGGKLFAEFGFVEVSTDGTHFARFSSVSLTPGPVGAFGTLDVTGVYGLAGKHAADWGTPFDLSTLANDPLVAAGELNLNDINYVRIVDIPGNGFYKDSEGNPIYDAYPTSGSGGFDLDAIGVINPVPEPSAFALLALGAAVVGWSGRKRFSKRKLQVVALTFLSVLLACASVARADSVTITQNFTTNPLTNGWHIFGDTNLFQWDSTNHDLAVTWDSSQPNSYFYHPLGTMLGGDDDFKISFDLQFADIAAGVNPDKSDAIQVAIGLFNFGDATGAFVRGDPVFPSASPDPKNVIEFDYFPEFVDPFFGEVDPSIAPTAISSNYQFDGAFGDFFTMTNGVSYHVQMVYTASNLTMNVSTTLTGDTNVLNFTTFTLSGTNDYRVDTFSISSYSDIGDDFDSLLAHGTVANVSFTVPPPPLSNITGGFTNGAWQVQFNNRSNWVYTLQSSPDLKMWSAASATTPGNGGVLTLQDTNAIAGQMFYRVDAQKP